MSSTIFPLFVFSFPRGFFPRARIAREPYSGLRTFVDTRFPGVELPGGDSFVACESILFVLGAH